MDPLPDSASSMALLPSLADRVSARRVEFSTSAATSPSAAAQLNVNLLKSVKSSCVRRELERRATTAAREG